MAKTRILLADDHGIVREGLKTLIREQPDMTVVGEAADGALAIKLAGELKPDVVVLDVSMPEVNGAAATRKIKRANAKIKVVALTVHEDKSYLEQLLSAGASGYVLKRTAPGELINALRAVIKGGTYLDPNVAGAVVETFVWKQGTGAVEGLTDRETSVAKLVAQGYTNKEIASQLGISVKTVETHKARSMEKLELRSRADLVRYAFERGWLQKH
jgi:DNA-binding NarL/FixJ family response regulator